MMKWWKRYLYGLGAAHHLESCPFCGQPYDIRDPGQVAVHYKHQVAAGAPAADDITPDVKRPPYLRKVVPFRQRRTD